jgi:hypothetical protein
LTFHDVALRSMPDFGAITNYFAAAPRARWPAPCCCEYRNGDGTEARPNGKSPTRRRIARDVHRASTIVYERLKRAVCLAARLSGRGILLGEMDERVRSSSRPTREKAPPLSTGPGLFAAKGGAFRSKGNFSHAVWLLDRIWFRPFRLAHHRKNHIATTANILRGGVAHFSLLEKRSRSRDFSYRESD